MINVKEIDINKVSTWYNLGLWVLWVLVSIGLLNIGISTFSILLGLGVGFTLTNLKDYSIKKYYKSLGSTEHKIYSYVNYSLFGLLVFGKLVFWEFYIGYWILLVSIMLMFKQDLLKEIKIEEDRRKKLKEKKKSKKKQDKSILKEFI